MFWVSAVMACLMLVAVAAIIPESDVRTGGRFDLLGALLLSAALIALLLGITKGGHWGWLSQKTVSTFLVAGLLFGAWVPWQLRAFQYVFVLASIAAIAGGAVALAIPGHRAAA